MYFENYKKRIYIEEALKTGTSLETFKKVIFENIPEFKTLDIPHEQPAHRYDIITHTYYVVQGVGDNKYAKLAALFHDVGKPASKILGHDGCYHYWHHPDVSYEIAKKILTDLEYKKEVIDVVCAMVKYHDTYINKNDVFFENAIKEIGPENIKLFCELQNADLNAHTEAYADKHREQLAEAHADYLSRAEKFL